MKKTFYTKNTIFLCEEDIFLKMYKEKGKQWVTSIYTTFNNVFNVTLTFGILKKKKKTFRMALVLFKENKCAKGLSFLNLSINVAVMLQTTAI